MRGERGESRAGYARARFILEEAARRSDGRDIDGHGHGHGHVDVGRVVKLGEGLSHEVFGAQLTVDPDPRSLTGPYVVLLPRSTRDPERDTRARNEPRLLEWLQTRSLAFRVPRPLIVLPDIHGVAVARAFVRGVPLDLRAGRQPSVRPWQVIAEIAASLHGVDMEAAPPPVPGFATRREHALAALQCLDGLDSPDLQDARAWALEHLPPAEPGALLHGDLLGQNVLLDPGVTPPFAVIDWEYATTGDPAYDLAIVTRGARRPFQIAGGLERLLDEYGRLSGRTIERSHVRIHELALAGLRYRAALERTRRGRPPPRGGVGGSPEGESAEDALGRLRRISRMVG